MVTLSTVPVVASLSAMPSVCCTGTDTLTSSVSSRTVVGDVTCLPGGGAGTRSGMAAPVLVTVAGNASALATVKCDHVGYAVTVIGAHLGRTIVGSVIVGPSLVLSV